MCVHAPGQIGDLQFSTSRVMAMAKMPSVSASMRLLERRMLFRRLLAELGGVLIWGEIVIHAVHVHNPAVACPVLGTQALALLYCLLDGTHLPV